MNVLKRVYLTLVSFGEMNVDFTRQIDLVVYWYFKYNT